MIVSKLFLRRETIVRCNKQSRWRRRKNSNSSEQPKQPSQLAWLCTSIFIRMVDVHWFVRVYHFYFFNVIFFSKIHYFYFIGNGWRERAWKKCGHVKFYCQSNNKRINCVTIHYRFSTLAKPLKDSFVINSVKNASSC